MSVFITSTLTAILFIYDIISYPIYLILQKPWKRLEDHKNPEGIKTALLNKKGGLTCHCNRPHSSPVLELTAAKIDNLNKLFKYAIKKYGNKECLGIREVFGEENEVQPDGMVFKKYSLGNYIWKTYNEVDKQADDFGRGVRELGMKPKDKLCIFAETRAEWLISAMAAFSQNLTIVTLFATLGEKGIIHGVNETEVEYIITSHELLPKLRSIIKQCPKVKNIIFMEDALKKTDISGFPKHVKLNSFLDIVERGSHSSIDLEHPSSEDIAIIMYTSGSTGIPKGVLLSHRNVTVSLMGLADALSPLYPSDVYIAYLPLAHVMEIMSESIFLSFGIRIGYSSTLTLTDNSGKIKIGEKGDATILQPTIMIVVPIILERLCKGIQEKMRLAGPTAQAIFKLFYDYKLKWYYRGFDTPLVNALIMKKIRKIVGGKVRFMAGGGAPLSLGTHEFIRNVMCCPMMQGYGLTETSASATLSIPTDMSIGRVGQPIGCTSVKLINWEEGKYKVDDWPFPRGEIVLGGDSVAMGYYKLSEATAQDFFEENGERWFKTGDIGLMEPDGVLKIIDRKKDLVKLQCGEYISLSKIEGVLKTCSLVDNICVYGESSENVCVALMVPTASQLEAIASKLNKNDLSLEQMCEDEDITKFVLKELHAHALKSKLQKFELPGALKLCSELWTPDSGFVTAAFKLKRKPIQEFYQKEINHLYASINSQ